MSASSHDPQSTPSALTPAVSMGARVRAVLVMGGFAVAAAIAPTHADADAPTVTPTIEGITAGGAASLVDVKCKVANVKCTKSARKTRSATLERTKIVLPAPSTFSTVYATTKDGLILSVKGRYRAQDSARFRTLKASFGNGPGTLRNGAYSWALANGIVATVNPLGHSLTYTDTRASTSKGLAITAQAMTAPRAAHAKIAPTVSSAGASLRANLFQNAAGNLAELGPPSPTVVVPTRIPVAITFNVLKCFDEDDATSWFHGDDPYIEFAGVHTQRGNTPPWTKERRFSDDIESGGTLTVNESVYFAANDFRHGSVGVGEAVAIEFTLMESDSTSFDDEIDFGYTIVDHDFAAANVGKSLKYTEYLDGDGASYTLTYTVDIGQPVTDTFPAVANAYRSVDPKAYQGSYAGFIGNAASEISLTFLASRNQQYLNGTLYGSLKDGAATASVFTTRLQGQALQLVAKYPSKATSDMDLYLSGDATHPMIIGSITAADGTTRGVVFTKK